MKPVRWPGLHHADATYPAGMTKNSRKVNVEKDKQGFQPTIKAESSSDSQLTAAGQPDGLDDLRNDFAAQGVDSVAFSVTENPDYDPTDEYSTEFEANLYDWKEVGSADWAAEVKDLSNPDDIDNERGLFLQESLDDIDPETIKRLHESAATIHVVTPDGTKTIMTPPENFTEGSKLDDLIDNS